MQKQAIRNSIVYVLLTIAFGVVVPAAKGLEFFDPTVLTAYACLGMVFAGPAAVQRFRTRPESFSQAALWILRAVMFGEAPAVTMLVCGITTVFERNRAAFFPPDVETLGYLLVLGLFASVALASLGAWAALEFSAGAGRMVLRLIFLGLLALFYLRGRWLPSELEPGILISAMTAVVFLMLLRRGLSNSKPGASVQP
jgi:hypothetical protein